MHIIVHTYTYSLREKLKGLAVLIHKALFSSDTSRDGRERGVVEGGGGLQRMVMSTMIQWAQVPIHSPELIQQIFSLLYRQCDEINEVVNCCSNKLIIWTCGVSNCICSAFLTAKLSNYIHISVNTNKKYTSVGSAKTHVGV